MKTKTLFILLCAFVMLFAFISCNKSKEDEDRPDLDALEMASLKDYSAKISGGWKIDKMVIKKDMYDESIPDSVAINVGRMNIEIQEDPVIAGMYNRMYASFYVKNTYIPFKSQLYSVVDVKSNNYSVFGLMESNLIINRIPYDELPESYKFLREYFFGDNYSMKLSDDQKTWTWNGMGGHIKEIILSRD